MAWTMGARPPEKIEWDAMSPSERAATGLPDWAAYKQAAAAWKDRFQAGGKSDDIYQKRATIGSALAMLPKNASWAQVEAALAQVGITPAHEEGKSLYNQLKMAYEGSWGAGDHYSNGQWTDQATSNTAVRGIPGAGGNKGTPASGLEAILQQLSEGAGPTQNFQKWLQTGSAIEGQTASGLYYNRRPDGTVDYYDAQGYKTDMSGSRIGGHYADLGIGKPGTYNAYSQDFGGGTGVGGGTGPGGSGSGGFWNSGGPGVTGAGGSNMWGSGGIENLANAEAYAKLNETQMNQMMSQQELKNMQMESYNRQRELAQADPVNRFTRDFWGQIMGYGFDDPSAAQMQGFANYAQNQGASMGTLPSPGSDNYTGGGAGGDGRLPNGPSTGGGRSETSPPPRGEGNPRRGGELSDTAPGAGQGEPEGGGLHGPGTIPPGGGPGGGGPIIPPEPDPSSMGGGVTFSTFGGISDLDGNGVSGVPDEVVPLNPSPSAPNLDFPDDLNYIESPPSSVSPSAPTLPGIGDIYSSQLPSDLYGEGGYSKLEGPAFDAGQRNSWAMLAAPAEGIAGDVDAQRKLALSTMDKASQNRANREINLAGFGQISGLRRNLVSEAMGNLSSWGQGMRTGTPAPIVGATQSGMQNATNLYSTDKDYDLGLKTLANNKDIAKLGQKSSFFSSLGGLLGAATGTGGLFGR